MTCNRHPADELADLRARMRDLKAREAELRRVLLFGESGLCGDDHAVTLKKRRRRVFVKDRLPGHILRDPALWEDRETTHVVTRPVVPDEQGDVPAPRRGVRPGDPVEMGPAHEDWGVDGFEVIETGADWRVAG